MEDTNPEELNKYKERAKSEIKLTDKQLDEIRTKKLGKINGVSIWAVDDELIRNTVDVDYTIGGNFARDAFIPENEIWISDLLSPSDYGPVITHEFIESYLMKNHGMEYEDAHDFANLFEMQFRRKVSKKEIKVKTNVDAFREANRLVRQFLAEAITKM